MGDIALIKNILFPKPQVLAELVGYEEGRVVSRTFAQSEGVSLTLFALDQDEGLSSHSAPGDAMVHILDGEAAITINKEELVLKAGEVVVIPAHAPHALHVKTWFKMLLTIVKKPK